MTRGTDGMDLCAMLLSVAQACLLVIDNARSPNAYSHSTLILFPISFIFCEACIWLIARSLFQIVVMLSLLAEIKLVSTN